MKVFFLILAFVFGLSKAQYGVVDTSFGNGGYVEIPYEDIPSLIYQWVYVKDAVVDSDDNLYVLVENWDPYEPIKNFLFKFLPNGSLDLSFGNNGYKLISSGVSLNKIVHSSELNKFFAIGTYSNSTPHNPYSKMMAYGFNMDGSHMLSYQPPTHLGSGSNITVDDEGNLLLVGSSFNSASAIAFRYLTNLQMPDYDFGTEVDGGLYLNISGTSYNVLSGVVIDNNDRIVYSGIGGSSGTVFRVFENGDLDTSFNGSGLVTYTSSSSNKRFSSPKVLVTPDNKVLVATSEIITPNYIRDQLYVKKFNENGTPDVTFGDNESRYFRYSTNSKDQLINHYILENGNIILAAYVQENGGIFKNYLLGLNENGEIDANFGENGWASSDFISYPQASEFHMNGIVVVGTGDNKLKLMKYNIDGIMEVDEVLSNKNKIQIYPNPTSNSFTIIGNESPIKEVKIFSEIGMFVKSIVKPTNQSKIEVNDLAPGVYFIEINSEDQKFAKKLIVK